MSNSYVPEENRIAFKWKDIHIYLPKIVISKDIRRIADQYTSTKKMSSYPDTDWDPQWDEDEDEGIRDSPVTETPQNPWMGLSIKQEGEGDTSNIAEQLAHGSSGSQRDTAANKILPKKPPQNYNLGNGVPPSTNEGENEGEFFKRKFYNKNQLFSKWNGVQTSEENQTPQACEKCGASYKDLKTHLQECPHSTSGLETRFGKGPGVDELKCSVCRKSFTKRIHLTLHMKIHAKMGNHGQPTVKTLKCNFCELLFSTNNELIAHFQATHYNKVTGQQYIEGQNGSKPTDEINGESPNLSTWSHDATQVLKEGTDPVTCDKCGRSFTSERYLKQHQVVHERVPLSCLFCGKTFTSNSSLMTHMLVHDEADKVTIFGCSRCGRRFGRQNQLNFHVKFCKAKIPEEGGSVSTSTATKHSNSSKKPHSSTIIQNVNQVCKDEEKYKSESSEEEYIKPPSPKYPCLDCGRVFNRINYLNSHMKSHNKLFVCKSCNTEIHENEYVEHVKSCTTSVSNEIVNNHPQLEKTPVSEEKTLPCDICGKLFSSDIQLSQHCLTHAFSFDTFMEVDSTSFQSCLPLLCKYTECERRFSDNVDLTNHIQQKHVLEDLLCCEVCGQDFLHGSNLVAHRSSVHNLSTPSERQETDQPASRPIFYYMQEDGSPPSPNPYILLPRSLKEQADEILLKKQPSSTSTVPGPVRIGNNNIRVIVDKRRGIKTRGMRRRREDIPFQNLYICKICGRRFNKHKRNHYINHLWFHNNDSKYGCHLCERKFCNENLLNEHVQRHSDPNFKGRVGRYARPDIPIQDIYTCETCDRRFPKHKRQQYIHHVWSHKREAQFGCNLCERKFLSQNLLDDHVKKHSDPNFVNRIGRRFRHDIPIQDVYVCETCDRRFPKKKRHQYMIHLSFHKREAQFGCNLCERKFLSQNLLDEHVKKHSDPNFVSRIGRPFRHDIPIQDVYICETCNRRFLKHKRQQYIIHLSFHRRESQFGCHLCERKFLSQNLLNDHLKKHADPTYRMRSQRQNIPYQDVYVCEVCDRRFPKHMRQRYIHHVWVHKREAKFGCHLCQRKFHSQNLLDEHAKKHSDPNFVSRIGRPPNQTKFYSQSLQLRKHSDGSFRKRVGRAGRKDIPFQDVYTCSKCDNKFNSRHRYMIHLWYHEQKASPQFKCQYCYKSFINDRLLAQHVEKHADPNYSNRPGRGGRTDIPIQDVYYCEECGEGTPYYDRQKYILHLNSHNAGRKLECPQCSRVFTNEGNLRYHLETHAKKYQCKDCLKMFNSKQARTVHQEKFCKKVPCKYKCSSCCDRFHSKLILTRHMEKEHSTQKEPKMSRRATEIEHPCPNCSQTFNTTFGLNRHIQIYHPTTAVTFADEVYDTTENQEENKTPVESEMPFNGEAFGEGENSTQSDWNASDHGGDDDFNITDMLATNFCETEMVVEEPAKKPDGRKEQPKTSGTGCQCGVLKKYRSQIFCHNRQCPCIRKGKKCGSDCGCKASCLNTDDIEHEQQQTFKESKEKMRLEEQSEQPEATTIHQDGRMIVPPPPVVHIQQTSFSNEINAASALSYGVNVPSEFISLDGGTDASIQQLSLSGYVEGEEDCDPFSDPLQSTPQTSNNVNIPKSAASTSGSANASILISALNSQPNQMLSCQFCGTNKKNFKLVSAYISHMLGHAKEIVGFNCPICKKTQTFTDVISLVRHVDGHNKGVHIQCKKCSSKFKSYSDMDKHLRVHHYKPMECGMCALKFLNSHDMMSHWSLKHPTCQCGVCNVKFFSYEDLTQHMKDLHSPVDCIHCSMRFEKLEELITHFNANHNQPTPLPVIISSTTSGQSQPNQMNLCEALLSFMNCGYCNKKFTNSDDLNEHLYTHLPQQQPSNSLQHANTEFYDKYVNLSCNECGATFNSVDDLTEHLGSHLQQFSYGQSTTPNEPVCYQQLNEPHQLEIDDDNNIDATEALTCPRCSKTFSRRGSYLIHVKSHNVEICPVCYTIFDSQQDIREHFRTSSCVLYECDICTKNFGSQKSLSQHKKTVHKFGISVNQHAAGEDVQPIIVASTSLAHQGSLENRQQQQQYQTSYRQQEIEEIILE